VLLINVQSLTKRTRRMTELIDDWFSSGGRKND